jgi:hypothetical protein
MKVNLKVGDTIGAEVIRIISGGLVVELDNCEEAVMPPSSFAGLTSNAKLDRMCRLVIGSKLQVEVTSTFVGRGFKNNISVKEVSVAARR